MGPEKSAGKCDILEMKASRRAVVYTRTSMPHWMRNGERKFKRKKSKRWISDVLK